MKTHQTRSQTRKAISSAHALTEEDRKLALSKAVLVRQNTTDSIPRSALTKHYISTGHVFTNNDFKGLLTEHPRYRPLIKESLSMCPSITNHTYQVSSYPRVP